MREPPLILVVDDNEANVDIIETRLRSEGYAIATARDGEEALERARALRPDLILLDVMMPKMDGFEVARRIKADTDLPFMPIIHVTAKTQSADIVTGLDAGADEYLTKPLDHAALLARVRSILRIKDLQDRTREQAARLEEQAGELDAFNRLLEQRVARQVAELERLQRLKRFLPAQVAEVIVSTEAERLLASHRREITVVFCDLRGFTSFSELAEPEEVMDMLAGYHARAGDLIERYEATLERFAGDGLMLFFNDPIPCENPIERAICFALDLRDRMVDFLAAWQRRGHPIGIGIGVTHGFATLGRIGFRGRGDYAAIGTVVNTASRLCDIAKPGQILVSAPVALAAREVAVLEACGEMQLGGLRRPIEVFSVLGPARAGPELA